MIKNATLWRKERKRRRKVDEEECVLALSLMRTLISPAEAALRPPSFIRPETRLLAEGGRKGGFEGLKQRSFEEETGNKRR